MSDLYETYVRTENGDTYYPGDIREGVKQFLSNDGYRLSFNIEGVVFTLRKDTAYDPGVQYLDVVLDSNSVDCLVTIRNFKES